MYIARENWTRAYLVGKLETARRCLERVGIRCKNRESYYIRDAGKHLIRITGSYNDLDLFELKMKKLGEYCEEVYEEFGIRED